MAARVVTSDEKNKLRRDGQWSKLYLAIHQPAGVFTARVTSAPADTDRVAQIAYNTGLGSGAIEGMTVCVGTTAGAWDKGQVRLRATPSLGASGTLDINETSDIAWANGDYLTILNEFGLWARQVRLVGTTPFVDYDIAYTDQHSVFAPVPVMGPPAAAWLSADGSVVVPFDAGDSWAIGGGLTGFLWTAPGGTIDDDTSATPNITYAAAGTYRVALAVTGNGRTVTAYRYVFIFDDDNLPVTQFECGGAQSADEGYSFSVKMYAEAALPTIRDRALVVLFAVDHYGADEVSLGPVTGRENIITWGWIQGESIEWNPEQSFVTFEVKPPGYWLGQIPAYTTGQENTVGVPAAWTQFQFMTVDKVLWHTLFWRSTLTNCCDWTLTGDGKALAELSAPAASLWEQLTVLAYQTLLAKPKFDRYGRLYVQIDGQFTPEADRAAFVEVMEITTADWLDSATLIRQPNSQVGVLDLSGVLYASYTATALFSLAHGRILSRLGRAERIERLVLASQSQSNELAGLVCGQMNNTFPSLTMRLAGNNRFFDTAPNQYALVTLAAGDTPRGAAFTLKRFLPRKVNYRYDSGTGGLTTEVEMEGETFAEIGITGDAPGTVPVPSPDNDPPPSPVATGDLVYAANEAFVGRTRNFLSASPNWEDVTGAAAGRTLRSLILNPSDPKNSACLVCAGRIFVTSDLESSPPTWAETLLATTVETAIGFANVEFYKASGSIIEEGKLYVAWNAHDGDALVGVSVSSDWGATWDRHTIVWQGSAADSPYIPKRIIASYTTAGLVYVATGTTIYTPAIYKSINSGATWLTLASWGAFQAVFDFDVGYPNADNIMYALINQSMQVWRSDNAGGAWTEVNSTTLNVKSGSGKSSEYLINIATSDNQDVLVMLPATDVDGSAWFWRSLDGGATWTEKYHNASVSGLNALGRWPYDTERVFVVGNGIYYSTDGMATAPADKSGDWASVMGDAFDAHTAVMIVPVWVP